MKKQNFKEIRGMVTSRSVLLKLFPFLKDVEIEDAIVHVDGYGTLCLISGKFSNGLLREANIDGGYYQNIKYADCAFSSQFNTTKIKCSIIHDNS